MSKQLDYTNLSDEDKAWLRARGQGHRIPGEGRNASEEGVVFDPNASAEEVLAATPNTGTATRPATVTTSVAIEYTEEDYASWSVDDLKAEIKDRNDAREDESDHIKPGSHKKDALVKALVADDQSQSEPAGEQPAGEQPAGNQPTGDQQPPSGD